MLYRVVGPDFVAGLILDETGKVIRTAPILAWLVGKSDAVLLNVVHRKGWRISDVWLFDASGTPLQRAAGNRQFKHILGTDPGIRFLR